MKELRTVIDKSVKGDLKTSVKHWDDDTIWVSVDLYVDELEIKQNTRTYSNSKVKTIQVEDQQGNRAQLNVWYKPEQKEEDI